MTGPLRGSIRGVSSQRPPSGSSQPRPDPGATALSPAHYKAVLPDELQLDVVSGPDRGRSLALRKGQRYVVGKSPDCDLPVTDRQVSRQHLSLDVGNDSITIRDLGSRNGSFFQGARFETIVVSTGASVVIGATELAVSSRGAKHDVEPSALAQFGD